MHIDGMPAGVKTRRGGGGGMVGIERIDSQYSFEVLLSDRG